MIYLPIILLLISTALASIKKKLKKQRSDSYFGLLHLFISNTASLFIERFWPNLLMKAKTVNGLKKLKYFFRIFKNVICMVPLKLTVI